MSRHDDQLDAVSWARRALWRHFLVDADPYADPYLETRGLILVAIAVVLPLALAAFA